MLNTLFILISLLSILFLYYGTGKNNRLILIFVSWQLLIGVLAYFQVLKATPNLFPLVILGSVFLMVLGLKIIDAKKVNQNFLLAIHILRIPVELSLYQLFLQGKIPKLMTYEGWNFDILIGISAMVILIYQLLARRTMNSLLFSVWSMIGIIFLLFIVSLAVLSSPLKIQQFAFDQPNIAVLEFPGLYMCIPNCKMITSKIEDSPVKQNGFLNWIIWTLLSIITFLPPSSINILSGICCLLTGIINLLGWIFRLQEEKEMKANTKYNAVPGERIPISGGAPRPSGSGNGLPSWAGGSAV